MYVLHLRRKGYSGVNCADLIKEFGYDIVIPKKKQKGKPQTFDFILVDVIVSRFFIIRE